mgnify:CR=1 FL=1
MSMKENPKAPKGKTIKEGSFIKGGQNPEKSKIEVRPSKPKPTNPKK